MEHVNKDWKIFARIIGMIVTLGDPLHMKLIIESKLRFIWFSLIR